MMVLFHIGQLMIVVLKLIHVYIYPQASNVRHTKSQNSNVSHLILQLSMPNPLKPGVKLRMKM